MAQEHLLRLGAAPDGATGSIAGVAGTAVKIATPGQGSLWLLSIDLSRRCEAVADKSAPPKQSGDCGLGERQLAGIAAWLEAKRVAGDPAIVAGSFRRVVGKHPMRALSEAQQFPPPRSSKTCVSARGDAMFDLVLLSPDRGLDRDHSGRGSVLPVSASGHCPIRLDLALQSPNIEDRGPE